MKVLVTGGSGFIGRHLTTRLVADGHVVRSLVRNAQSRPVRHAGVEVIQGDVRDAHQMTMAAAGVDAIVHLAAKVHEVFEIADEAGDHTATNVEGTRHVLEAATSGAVRVVVFFSSVKAMGECTDGCQDESGLALPTTLYGKSKLAAEDLVFDWGRQAGHHSTCLRLCAVYGVGNRGNLARLIAAIEQGCFPPLPEFGNRRSFVHVADVVDAALLALEKSAAGARCYIVAEDQSYSTRELYALIVRALGRSVPHWHVPRTAFRALALAGDMIGRMRGRRFLFDSDALEKLTLSAWYSAAKITRELGWRPSRRLETSLDELVRSHRMGSA